jgi:hypothetical protein
MTERDEWWNDWSQATAASKWGGDMTTDVEAMYQAFKARLMQELFPKGETPSPFDVKIVPLGLKEDPLFPVDNPIKR